MLLGARTLAFYNNSNVGIPFILLNSTGARKKSLYFRTGVIPDERTRLDVCLMCPSDANAGLKTGCQSGCRAGWIRNAFQLAAEAEVNAPCRFVRNSRDIYSSQPDTINLSKPVVLSLRNADGGSAYVDGVLKGVQGEPFSTSRYEIYIGDVNESGYPKGSSDSQGTMMLLWAEIYDGDVLTHRYVPTMDKGNVYLEDKVKGELIAPSGDASLAFGYYQNGKEVIVYPPSLGDVYFCGYYENGFRKTETVVGKIVSGSVKSGNVTVKFNGAKELRGFSEEASFNFKTQRCSVGEVYGWDLNGPGTLNWYNVFDYGFDLYIMISDK